MIKHAILAFEFYRAHDNLARLEQVGDRSLDDVLALFRDLDSLELALYGQIVKQRLSVIRNPAEQGGGEPNREGHPAVPFHPFVVAGSHWERIETTKQLETEVRNCLTRLRLG